MAYRNAQPADGRVLQTFRCLGTCGRPSCIQRLGWGRQHGGTAASAATVCRPKSAARPTCSTHFATSSEPPEAGPAAWCKPSGSAGWEGAGGRPIAAAAPRGPWRRPCSRHTLSIALQSVGEWRRGGALMRRCPHAIHPGLEDRKSTRLPVALGHRWQPCCTLQGGQGWGCCGGWARLQVRSFCCAAPRLAAQECGLNRQHALPSATAAIPCWRPKCPLGSPCRRCHQVNPQRASTWF